VRHCPGFLISLALLFPARAAGQCAAWRGFDAPVSYASAADNAVMLRDLDGDALPEIIASANHVHQLTSFSILSNRGSGIFGPAVSVGTSLGERVEGSGDLTGDGIIDIVTTNYWGNGIAVYRGLGGLQFAEGTAYATATHGGPTIVVDYDGDRALDVISFSSGSGNPVRVHFFRGTSGPALSPKVTIDTSLAIASTASMRTMNGALEIVVAERSGNLGLVRHAAGSVSVSRLPAGPGFDLAAIFADLNADGIADLVYSDDSSGLNESVFVSLGRADGSFAPRVQLPHRRRMELPFQLRAVDVDGDGRTDLVAADFQASKIVVFRGNGAGEFAEGIEVDAGGPVNAFEAADLNGDRQPDIVAVNNNETIAVLLNRGGCSASRRRAVRH
jgi:hypothetical protein